MLKRAALAVTVAGMMLVLSGCLVLMGPVKGSQDGNHHVKVRFAICESSDTATPPSNPNCPDQGNSKSASTGGGFGWRVLIGLRVSKNVRPPSSFASLWGTPGTMVLNGTFTNELRTKAPQRDDQKWFGYVSSTNVTPNGTAYAKFNVRMAVRPSFDKRAVKVRPTVGFDGPAPDCGPSVFGPTNGSPFAGRCIDSPAPTGIKSIRIPFKRN